MSERKKVETITNSTSAYPIFVDGLSAVTPVGTVTHLLFTTRQTSTYEKGVIERVVQARLVVPTDLLETIARIMLAGKLDIEADEADREEVVAVH